MTYRIQSCLRAVLLGSLFAVATWAATDVKVPFDLPAGRASETLKKFAQTSGRETLFAAEVVRGVFTHAVHGELTAEDALGQMLEGTGLMVVADAKSGALAVRKDSDPNASRAVANPSDRPNRLTSTEDGTLELDQFEVVGRKVEGWNNKTLFDTSENAPLAYDVVTREEMDRLGVSSIYDLFRLLPSATSYGYGPQNGGFAAVTTNQGVTTPQADSVSIRGFPANQVVVLVNGRRLTGALALTLGSDPTGSDYGADIGKIPVAMIDHVEILPASAGAIYGGGAIGGVINVILKKNFDSKSITSRISTATEGGATDVSVSAFEGRTFNDGRTSLTLSLSYDKTGSLRAGQRDYLDRAVAKYQPGTTGFTSYVLPLFASNPGTIYSVDGVTPLGIPGNPTALYARVPAGLTHEEFLQLTPADFSAGAGEYNTDSSLFDTTMLIAPQETWSFQGQLDHDFLPDGKLSLFSELALSTARSDYTYKQRFSAGFGLTATDALNPFRTAVTGAPGVRISLYYSDPDIPPSHFENRRDNVRAVIGLKGKLGERWSWASDVIGEYTINDMTSTVPDNLLSLVTSRGLAVGSRTTTNTGYTNTPVTMGPDDRLANIYSPFVDHDLYPVSDALLEEYFNFERFYRDIVKVGTWESRLNGEVYDLPAGPALLSTGFELKSIDEPGYQKLTYAPGLVTVFGINPDAMEPKPFKSSVTERSAYVEAVIPIIGGNFHPIPIHALELDASKRWEDINHGRAASPTTIAGRLAFTPWLAVRGSQTEGFARLRASDIAASTESTITGLNIDPERGNTFAFVTVPTFVTGGNPDLRPQFSRSTDVGVLLTPQKWSLTAQVDRWKTSSFDAIQSLSLYALTQNPSDYPADRLVRADLTPEDAALGYTGGEIIYANITPVNVAHIITEGWDFKMSWTMPVPAEWGRLTFAGSATKTDSYEFQGTASSTPQERVGIQVGSAPRKWAGYAGLYWRKDRHEINVTASYYDKYLTNTTATSVVYPSATGVDGDYIPSNVLWDLQFAYKVPQRQGSDTWRSWWSGTKWTLGSKNIFNTEPPLVSDGTGFYSRYYDPRQRTVYFQLEKSF